MQTTIRMPLELYKKLKRRAKERGMTVNGLMVSMLWDYLTKEGG